MLPVVVAIGGVIAADVSVVYVVVDSVVAVGVAVSCDHAVVVVVFVVVSYE